MLTFENVRVRVATVVGTLTTVLGVNILFVHQLTALGLFLSCGSFAAGGAYAALERARIIGALPPCE